MVQEYTDDTAELRRLLDALGGMAALQQPELQLQAIMELEQAVSAVRGMVQFWGFWQLGLRLGGTCADDRPGPWVQACSVMVHRSLHSDQCIEEYTRLQLG